MPSIRQNPYPDALPDFRNLGVTARALIVVNLLALAAALVSARGLAGMLDEFVLGAALIEPPLVALSAGGAIAISTIAEVTFYGEDLAGNGFATSGSMSVNFADWADSGCSGS